MRHWLLFYRPEGGVVGLSGQGEAHLLNSTARLGPVGDDFDLGLQPDDNDELLNAAYIGGALGYRLLSREKLLRNCMTIRFDAKALPRNIHGRSSELIFSLAVICNGIKQNLACPAIAATGVLNAAGDVLAVKGIVPKLLAAIAVMPPGGIAFYPAANRDEIDAELLIKAQRHKIDLVPVSRLDQAATRLGIALFHTWLESPYRGLEAFGFEHRGIYFGRQSEIDHICKRLIRREKANRTGILVLAHSGAGKSSLVLAGVIPALVDGNYANHDVGLDWQVWQPQRVETRDEAGLCASILLNWMDVPALSRLKNEANPIKLSDLLAYLVRNQIDGRRFIWVVDQLEELFTLGFQEEAISAFADFVLALQRIGVWVIGTLRSDFYANYQRHEPLVTVFGGDGLYDLSMLHQEALRQIIEEPAKAKDLFFEKNENGISLVERLLTDVAHSTDSLPLLEFTLSELYRERDDARHMLTFKAYDVIGGIKGAIGKAAERAFGAHEQTFQNCLPRLLFSLVHVAELDGDRDTAQVVSLANATFDDETHTLINKLVAERLLVKSGGVKGLQLRVAHEALLSHWPLAKQIIDEGREFLLSRDRMLPQAMSWQDGNCDPSWLLGAGLPLEQAENLIQRFSEELEAEPLLMEFILASKEAERLRQRKLSKTINLHAEYIKLVKLIERTTIEGRILFFLVVGFILIMLNHGWNEWEGRRRAHNAALKEEQKRAQTLATAVRQKADADKVHIDHMSAQIARLEQLVAEYEKRKLSPDDATFLANIKNTIQEQKQLQAVLAANQATIEALTRHENK